MFLYCCLWTRSKTWDVPADAGFVCRSQRHNMRENPQFVNRTFVYSKTLHGEETLLEFVKVTTVEFRNNPWVKYKYLRCPLYSSTEKSVVLTVYS